MQAVAQALVKQGHEVVWLTHRDHEARVRASGATFVPTSALLPLDEPLRQANQTGLLDGNSSRLKGRVLAQVADYRAALNNFQADLLLVDVMPHGAKALMELGEIPIYVTLGVIPMYSSFADCPPAVSGRTPPTTWLGMIRNWVSHQLQRWIVFPLTIWPIVNQQRLALGLPALPYGERLEDFLYSQCGHLQASTSALEFITKTNQQSFPVHFTGPLLTRDLTPPGDIPDWFVQLRFFPRVIAITQGTLATDPTSLILPSIEALASDQRNILVVVSPHAQEIERKFAEKNHKNVFFAKWLPYHLLLSQINLLITNGGYGSITQAISSGVPLICAGQSEDKKDTAARVTYTGTGIDLETDIPSIGQIQSAVRRILDQDESYYSNISSVADQLNVHGGAWEAARSLVGFTLDG